MGSAEPVGMVSVGVVARNEEASLPGLLADLEAQAFPLRVFSNTAHTMGLRKS